MHHAAAGGEVPDADGFDLAVETEGANGAEVLEGVAPAVEARDVARSHRCLRPASFMLMSKESRFANISSPSRRMGIRLETLRMAETLRGWHVFDAAKVDMCVTLLMDTDHVKHVIILPALQLNIAFGERQGLELG